MMKHDSISISIPVAILRLVAALAGVPPQMMRQRTTPANPDTIPLQEEFQRRVQGWLDGQMDMPADPDTIRRSLAHAVMSVVPLVRSTAPSPLRSRLYVRLVAVLEVMLASHFMKQTLMLPPAPPSVIQEVYRDLVRMPFPAILPHAARFDTLDVRQAIAAYLAGETLTPDAVLASVRAASDAAWLCRVGLNHAVIWDMVARDGSASFDLLMAGWTDPVLYSSLSPTHASALLRHRPDLRTVDHLFTLVSRHAWSAGETLIHVPESRHRSLVIEGAAQSSATAGQVLLDVPELRTNHRLIEAALSDSTVAVRLIEQMPEIRHHPAWRELSSDDPYLARTVLSAYPDLADQPPWIRVAARDAHVSRDLILMHPQFRDRRELITAVARSPWMACDVVTAVADLEDHPSLLAAIAKNPLAARTALIRRPSLLRHEILVRAVAKRSEAAWDVVVKVPAARHEYLLMSAIARSAADAGMLLCTFPESRTLEWLIQRASEDPAVARHVMSEVPELRQHPRLATHACATS